MANWTDRDIMVLRELSAKLPAVQIANRMKRSEIAIRRAAARFGIELLSIHADWTPEDLETLRRLSSERIPISLISKQMGRTEHAIKRKAGQLGLTLKAPGQKRFR